MQELTVSAATARVESMSGPSAASLRQDSSIGAGLGMLLLASAAVAQQTTIEAELQRCAATEPELARLICFDALARELGEENTAQGDAVPTAAGDTNVDAAEIEDIDAFGAELLGEGAARGPDEIRSRIIGEFTGWRGNTEFRLENGQVWRQTDNDRLVHAAESPLVTIQRGAFSTYRLTVEGLNSSCRVRRVE